MTELDASTQAWIDAKHDEPRGITDPDDPAIAGAAAAVAEARAGGNGATQDLFAAPALGATSPSFLPPPPPRATEPPAPGPAFDQASAPPADPQGEASTPLNLGDGAGAAAAAGEREPEQPTAPAADDALASALAPQLSLDTGDAVVKHAAPGLADKFVAPPFSVLDTRAGYWQERRRAWLSLGMRGETTAEQELGRKQGLIYQHDAPASDPAFYTKKTAVEQELGRKLTTEEFKRDHYRRDEQDFGASASVATGTSVFDPVLCEIAYRWFSGSGQIVLDPFAGGVVRGLVAGVLGRRYIGIELRPEQIADNRRQAGELLGPESALDFGREAQMPEWHEADATQLRALELPQADLVFTCPPYADLEVYSDNPCDLSTAPYATFRAMLSSAMAQSVERLKPNRFAVWVIGEARGRDGNAYGLIADLVRAGRDAGLELYNEAILLNSVGSAALRAQRILRTRKLTRVHQHVLVFVKGDGKAAADACGSAELERAGQEAA